MYLQEKSAAPDAEKVAPDAGNAVTAGEGGEVLTFGHYRLGRELGRGCSSIVYAAHDGRHAVALKVLTLPQTPDEERRRDLEERFRREAQAVSTLSHPNIVAIYDVGRGEDGRQFIAMEHLPGETLRRRLRQETILSVPVAVAIGVRVAEALHYAHGRGIIHRDVKPDNIFLAHDGAEAATPKLMDFGVAHVSSDQALTQDGMIIGSPAYLSPEQIHGLPPDARTDVFALAVTLAEMVTGLKPFEAETLPALMQKILHHDPDLRAVADRRLRRVLAKALAKNPGARYPDAWALAQALRRLAPFAASAPSIATQRLAQASLVAAPLRPRRRLSRLGAVGLGAVGLGVAGLGGLAFASLAAFPSLTGRALSAEHPPQASPHVASPRIALADPVTPVPVTPVPVTPAFPLAPRRIRRIDAGGAARGAERQAHAPVRAASAYPPHPKEDDNVVVRIVEEKPSAGVFPHPFPSAPLARASRSPRPPATRLITSVLVPPARPEGTYPPHRGVLYRPVATHTLESHAPRPVIRVAASHQERGQNRGASSAVTTPADAPPSPLSRPMPHPVDDLDLADTTVRVRLSVDERGEVTEADILRSSGSDALDDAALDAVGRWQYAPALRGGQPVPGVAVEDVEFAP